MKKIYNNILEVIGETPLIRIKKIEKLYNLKSNLYVKLESKNPGGSAKDRPALEMVMNAVESNLINKDTTIIEPTSGNTGIGLSMVCAYLDIKLVIIMPSNMSKERINLMSIYGAEVILTDASLGMQGAIDKANQMHKENKNSIILGQFDNPSNPKAHYSTTGPEIYDSLDGKIDYFVSSIGTGGTITGVGEYLKNKDDRIKVIGVEPLSSPFISKGIKGPHQIQGIGAGFIPSILNRDLIDEVITVSDEDAFLYSKTLTKEEGILSGISSGAALKAGVELALRKENEGKNIIILLPDSGERYMSTSLFDIDNK